MVSWLTAIALTGVLLLASATVAGEPSSSFAATNLQWKGPATIKVTSPLMDLRLPAEVEPTQFRLSAAHVRVETDSQRKIVAGPAVSTATEPAKTSSVEFSDWDSDWQARGGAGLFLESGPDAILSAAATAGAMSVPVADCLAEPTYFTTGRPANCPPLADVVGISTDSPSWSIQGDFTLSLWRWESISEPELWSGAQPTSAGSDGIGEQEFRLVHLFVRQGLLEFSGVASHLDGYALSAILSSASEAAISVTGGTERDLLGRHTIEVHRSAATLDARTVASSSASPPWSSPAAWSSLALVGLFAIPGSVVVLRRRLAANHMLHASHNMMIGNYDAAVSHALDATRHGQYRREGSLVASIGMLRAGDLESAEPFIHSLSGTLDRAAIAYLLANLRALQGRAREAKALLHECGHLDPKMQSEIDANPLFSAVLAKGAGAGYQ